MPGPLTVAIQEKRIVFTAAFAQTPGLSGGGADVLMQLAPFGIILVIMYFLILRPQQRRAKDVAAMTSGVRRGDVVVTAGGIVGRVTKTVDDAEVEIEIAPNVRVRLMRQMISDVRSKGEPVKDAAAK